MTDMVYVRWPRQPFFSPGAPGRRQLLSELSVGCGGEVTERCQGILQSKLFFSGDLSTLRDGLASRIAIRELTSELERQLHDGDLRGRLLFEALSGVAECVNDLETPEIDPVMSGAQMFKLHQGCTGGAKLLMAETDSLYYFASAVGWRSRQLTAAKLGDLDSIGEQTRRILRHALGLVFEFDSNVYWDPWHSIWLCQWSLLKEHGHRSLSTLAGCISSYLKCISVDSKAAGLLEPGLFDMLLLLDDRGYQC